jgi:putative oxidoreductase
MFRRLIATHNDFGMFITRVVLGAVMLPHGLQKLFGWFGGYGFSGTLAGFQSMGIPKPITVLVILAESVGAIGLIVGVLGRFMAFSVFATMVGAVYMVHGHNGFFMNWGGKVPGAEGYEYHLLVMGMAFAVMIRGSGALSVDRAFEAGTIVDNSRVVPAA